MFLYVLGQMYIAFSHPATTKRKPLNEVQGYQELIVYMARQRNNAEERTHVLDCPSGIGKLILGKYCTFQTLLVAEG